MVTESCTISLTNLLISITNNHWNWPLAKSNSVADIESKLCALIVRIVGVLCIKT